MSIQIEERPPTKPGKPIAVALIGPSLDVFEIYVNEKCTWGHDVAQYYVNHVQVCRDVYLDALQTANMDRWDPELADEVRAAEESDEDEGACS